MKVESFDCFKIKKNGSVQSKLESCVVHINGDTVTIEDVGGVATHITWVAIATDGDGNKVSTTCETQAVNPASNNGCNQGVGNGTEGCDPGNSNQGNPGNSNDENDGKPGKKGSKS